MGPRLSVSNPLVLIGWARQAINGQPALALLFGGLHARATLAFVSPGERKRISRMEARRISSYGEKRSTSYACEES